VVIIVACGELFNGVGQRNHGFLEIQASLPLSSLIIAHPAPLSTCIFEECLPKPLKKILLPDATGGGMLCRAIAGEVHRKCRGTDEVDFVDNCK